MTASQSAARQYSVSCDEWGRRDSEGKFNYEEKLLESKRCTLNICLT